MFDLFGMLTCLGRRGGRTYANSIKNIGMHTVFINNFQSMESCSLPIKNRRTEKRPKIKIQSLLGFAIFLVLVKGVCNQLCKIFVQFGFLVVPPTAVENGIVLYFLGNNIIHLPVVFKFL